MNKLSHTPVKFAADDEPKATAFGGLATLDDALRYLGAERSMDEIFGSPGSNRGYWSFDLMSLMLRTMHVGGDHVSDGPARCDDFMISRGHKAPSPQTMLSFLKRMGGNKKGMDKFLDRMCEAFMADEPMDGPGRVFDIDEFFVRCDKTISKVGYTGEKGMMVTVVFDSATGMLLSYRQDHGNSKPGHDRTELLDQAQHRVGGRRVSLVRADAAYDTSEMKNWCVDRGIDFIFRTNRSDVVARIATSEVSESQWRDVDGEPGLQSAVSVYKPHGCKVCHDLHIYRGRQASGQAGISGVCNTFAISTSLSDSSERILQTYNMRGEDCENRIKEFRSDLAAGTLPSSSLDTNDAWLMVCTLAYNLFKLMARHMFKGCRMRMKAFRLKVYCMACRIVRSGRQVRFHADRARLRLFLIWRNNLYLALAP